MVIQLLVPGMEHLDDPGCSAKIFPVGGKLKLQKDLGTAAVKQAVKKLLDIDIIVQGDQAGIVLPEDFHIRPDLKVIPSEARHILDDTGFNIPLPHLIDHALKCRAVESGAGDSSIHIVSENCHPVGESEILKNPLLVHNGV